jgi:Holliday junction resolvasome RuvABC endonuclease subunit
LIYKKVLFVLRAEQPSVVAVEGYAFNKRGSAVTLQAEVGAAVRLAIMHAGFDVLEVPPSQWKSRMLPKELRSSKVKSTKGGRQRIFDYIASQHGLLFESMDVADAYLIATYVKGYRSA